MGSGTMYKDLDEERRRREEGCKSRKVPRVRTSGLEMEQTSTELVRKGSQRGLNEGDWVEYFLQSF